MTGDIEQQAIEAEIALLGVDQPDLEDVGEGGVRAVCKECVEYWLYESAFTRSGYPWHTTDYPVPALRAYVEHVHEEHLIWENLT